ncbi:MAG: hypothetical protein JOZ74_10335 [Bradyrhizobium sp.]|nr:hypothetical protein [Bradyrhizobium sp.]
MVLKRLVPALVGAAAFAVVSAAMADEYRPDEYFGLDLSKAVLSPKRLGPPQEFAPLAVEAESERSDRQNEANWARDELKTEPRKVAVQDIKVTHRHRVPHVASGTPTGSARIRLAHRHRNPLDAQAMDTRIQKWPCNGGSGICDWK